MGDPGQHRVTDPEMTVLWEGIWPSLGEAAQGGGGHQGEGPAEKGTEPAEQEDPGITAVAVFYFNCDEEATWTLHGGFCGPWGTAV